MSNELNLPRPDLWNPGEGTPPFPAKRRAPPRPIEPPRGEDVPPGTGGLDQPPVVPVPRPVLGAAHGMDERVRARRSSEEPAS